MTHRVKFVGVDRAIAAEDGEVLLTAAQRNGVHIDSSCGGNGSCHQCRVLVHDGREFLQRDGQPAESRYEKDGQPIFLACQGRVCGELTVEAAPIEKLNADRPNASLLGWSVGDTGSPFTVIDPGAFTGSRYVVSIKGEFASAAAFRTDEVPDTYRRTVVVGQDFDRGECLAAGVRHLKVAPVAILDVAGFIHDGELSQAPTGAFLGAVPHLPGAIDSVEWSPLKTRTVITTVGNKQPTGLSAAGLMSCLTALANAGMVTPEWQFTESRFTRETEHGLQAMIVGPHDEAQSPHGVVYKTETEIVVPQTQLNAINAAAHELRSRLSGREGTLVVTGEFGTFVPPALMQMLRIWDGPVEFVPHAAALGAARLAV